MIMCSVHVFASKSISDDDAKVNEGVFKALWDTGATGSAITELAARSLQLKPKGYKNISGLGGTLTKKTYLIDLVLPNNIVIKDLSVTELDNPVDVNGNKLGPFGIIIGMDIINMGDFCITNLEGKTVMTFRMPSLHTIDYCKNYLF